MLFNKPIIIVVGGLPASGKTYYAKELVNSLNRCVLVDDFSLTKMPPIFLYLKQETTVVVTDPHFVLENFRKKFEQKYSADAEIFYIMFENDKEQCLLNAELRDNKPVRGLINYLSVNYTLPKTCKVLPVWRPNVN